MEKDKLKIALIQKVISCEDIELLQDVRAILEKNSSEVREESEKYITENIDAIPDLYYEELKEDYESYRRGELTTSSWGEVKENIYKRHGF